MPSQGKEHFREAERRLDDALRRDLAAITAVGIEVHDDSERADDYKSLNRSWSLRFESRRTRGSEVEKVWGRISVLEADVTVAKIWRRAEIFEFGARPRWEASVEREVSLEFLLHDGLARAVIREIEEGKAAAAGR